MYHYLRHRDDLLSIVNKYIDKETAVPNWNEAAKELNSFFEEEQVKQIWKKRYYRAKKFKFKYMTGDYAARAQNLTENHLRKLGTLEQGRASVLTEEALKTLEQQAVPMEFQKEFKQHKTKDNYIFVTSDYHFDGNEEQLSALVRAHTHIAEKQKEFGFKKITLLELGDVVEGSHLRPSQLLAIKTMLIPQVISVARAYSQFLHELTKTMHVDFYCVTSSNHTQTRAFGTGRNELVEDDAMLIFAEVVKTSMSKNKNFTFYAARDFMVNVTENHKMFVAHGHLLSFRKNGYVQELAMARGITFDYALFGHFHHYREITIYGRETFNMKVFYSPAMVSKTSDYEVDRNLSSKSAILMMVFNEERGHKYCEELFL